MHLRGLGGGQASYIFPLRIACKMGEGAVQKACKIAYVLNGWPHIIFRFLINIHLITGEECTYMGLIRHTASTTKYV